MSSLILWLIVLAIIIIVAIVFVVNRSVRAHRLKVAAGKEDLVGRIAVAETALQPKGVVLIEGERWTATAENGKVEPSEEVIVTGVNGLKLKVTKKE